MPSPRRNSQSGFALTEFKFCLMIIGVGILTCRCMQASAGIAEVDANRFRQAVAIAQGQSEFSMGLPFERFEPTGGFLPANWISQPGYGAGEMNGNTGGPERHSPRCISRTPRSPGSR